LKASKELLKDNYDELTDKTAYMYESRKDFHARLHGYCKVERIGDRLDKWNMVGLHKPLKGKIDVFVSIFFHLGSLFAMTPIFFPLQEEP